MTILDDVRTYASAGFHSVTRKGLEVIETPWAIGPHEHLDIYAEDLGNGRRKLSDRGQIAELLADAGVDLNTRSRRRAWDALRGELPPALLTSTSPYEIATESDDNAGQALYDLAAVCLRAWGLSVLGPQQRRTWTEALMQRRRCRARGQPPPMGQEQIRWQSTRRFLCFVRESLCLCAGRGRP